MLAKHVHALNLLNVNIIRVNFPECVYVWRLILKKNTLDLWVFKNSYNRQLFASTSN